MEDQNKSSATKIISIVLFLLFAVAIGINIFLYRKNKASEISNEVFHNKLDSVELIKEELERQVREARENILVYKGRNRSLDSLLSISNQQIDLQRKQIKELAIQASSINEMKDQIEQFKRVKDNLLEQVEALMQDNRRLNEKSNSLKQSLDKYQSERVESQKTQAAAIDSLIKASTTNARRSEKKQETKKQEASTSLKQFKNEPTPPPANVIKQNMKSDSVVKTDSIALASKKVAIAINDSILKTGNITVNSYKLNSDGDMAENNRAKKVKRIEICGDIFNNNNVQPGSIDIFWKIITPKGNTLSLTNNTFRIIATKEQSLYTTRSLVNYYGEQVHTCTSWEKDSGELLSGTYQIEVYINGYLSGTQIFVLK